MGRVKRIGKIIPAGQWSDSATENLLYRITRPPEERVDAGRELVLASYRHIHGRALPRMSKTVRILEPDA